MKRNNVKEILKRGEPIAVPEINSIFSPKIVETLGMLGYECVWIDMEHSDLSYERLSEMTIAARGTGTDVIVRIAKGGYTSIIKPLETGASGLVLPHCMSVEEGREFVRMAKFAPLGLRGVGCGVDSHYGLDDLTDYMKQANEETLLIAQIEDKEAVDEVDDIAAIEGIDLLFVGPVDLSQSYGVAGQLAHPLILQAIDKVALACKKYGKSWGIRVFSEEQIDDMLKKGAQFLNITAEMEILLTGFKEALENAKKQFNKYKIEERHG